MNKLSASTRRQLLSVLFKPTEKATAAAVSTAKQTPKAVKYLDNAADAAIKNPGAYTAFDKGNQVAASYLARKGTGGRLNSAVEAIVPDASITHAAFNNKHVPVSRRLLLKLLGVNAMRGRRATAKALFKPDDRRLYFMHRALNAGSMSGLEPLKLGNTAMIAKEIAPPKFLARNKKRLATTGALGLGGGGAYEAYDLFKGGAERDKTAAMQKEAVGARATRIAKLLLQREPQLARHGVKQIAKDIAKVRSNQGRSIKELAKDVLDKKLDGRGEWDALHQLTHGSKPMAPAAVQAATDAEREIRRKILDDLMLRVATQGDRRKQLVDRVAAPARAKWNLGLKLQDDIEQAFDFTDPIRRKVDRQIARIADDRGSSNFARKLLHKNKWKQQEASLRKTRDDIDRVDRLVREQFQTLHPSLQPLGDRVYKFHEASKITPFRYPLNDLPIDQQLLLHRGNTSFLSDAHRSASIPRAMKSSAGEYQTMLRNAKEQLKANAFSKQVGPELKWKQIVKRNPKSLFKATSLDPDSKFMQAAVGKPVWYSPNPKMLSSKYMKEYDRDHLLVTAVDKLKKLGPVGPKTNHVAKDNRHLTAAAARKVHPYNNNATYVHKNNRYEQVGTKGHNQELHETHQVFKKLPGGKYQQVLPSVKDLPKSRDINELLAGSSLSSLL